MSSEPFFDLASLAKALVTAPLALEFLDLDKDRREQLGYTADKMRGDEPITVRQFLSHSSGLPPWLPFSADSTVPDLITNFKKYGIHPLLRSGIIGTSVYSDLNFRSLAELLVLESSGQSYQSLAEKKFLIHQPWTPEKTKALPVEVPDGPDRDTWIIAAPDGIESYPKRELFLPHDANSRAGMIGHAGFGANKEQFTSCLQNWLEGGWPELQAVPTSVSEEGVTWGLGLWQVKNGPGRYGDFLLKLQLGPGVHVIEETTTSLSTPVELGDAGENTDWWMHTGFTGPIVFVNPKTKTVVAVLMHRLGPEGELIDIDARRARQYSALAKL